MAGGPPLSPIQVKRGDGGGPSPKPRVEYGGGGGRHSNAAGAVASVSPSFDMALEATEIEELLDQLDDLSSRLSVFPAVRLVAEYRSVLTELLRRAMRGFHLKRDLRWRKSDRKMYVTIERVEEAMDELEEAFQYEGDRTRALALMEEIKGCLISILL